MTGDQQRTFSFIDLAGFTAVTEVHGDEEAVALLDRFVSLVQGALGDGDHLVKTIGDAAMVTSEAPERALALAEKLFTACLHEHDFPVPRAGLHHGAAIARDGDWFGATVNLAARVAAQAHGGQVLATHDVADAARSRRLDVVDLGEFDLRNVSEPVHLWEVLVTPPHDAAGFDPVCRMRVVRDRAAGRLRHAGVDYWFCSLDCAGQFAVDPERFGAVAVPRTGNGDLPDPR